MFVSVKALWTVFLSTGCPNGRCGGLAFYIGLREMYAAGSPRRCVKTAQSDGTRGREVWPDRNVPV